jgi:hypothetical protein
VSNEIFEDAESGVVPTHPVKDSLIRTNVQGWDEWIADQDALRDERLAKYDREDYYSILSDLYQHVNPTLAHSLILEVKRWGPPMEWLDHAIVVVTALQKQSGNYP